jgi:hypothetical protein
MSLLMSMSEFLFEDILLIIRCNGMQKVLDRPFCNSKQVTSMIASR